MSRFAFRMPARLLLTMGTATVLATSTIALPTLTGNPVAPTNISLMAPYQITATCVASFSGYFLKKCDLKSAPSNIGPWIYKATWNFNGGPGGIHTFTVVNQVAGTWWWEVEEVDVSFPIPNGTVTTVSAPYGGYTSP